MNRKKNIEQTNMSETKISWLKVDGIFQYKKSKN